MKIAPKQYAQALLELIEDKSDEEISLIIKKFSRILIKNNDSSKTAKIIEQFKALWNEKNKILEVKAIAKEELSQESIQGSRDYIARLTGAREIKFRQTIDKNILGGIILKYDDKILDGSVRNRLNEMKKVIS